MQIHRFLTITACSLLASCGNFHDFERPISSGLRKIPQARQMQEIFGPAVHEICNLRDDKVTADWITIVAFGGRYELKMIAPIRVSRDFSEIEQVLGPPAFELLEVTAVSNGGYGAKYDPAAERHFGVDQWVEIYRTKGDFSVAGIHVKKNQPVRDFEKYRAILLRSARGSAVGQ